MPLMTELEMTVKGRDLRTGLPVAIQVSSDEMEIAMKKCINQIADEIKNLLERTPPEIVSDIVETGIVLSGGGALIKDIDKYIEERTGVHTTISPNPLESVVVGIPNLITEVEKRAVEEALYGSGAKRVLLFEETLASAIGSGIKIDEAKGKMIVDIGGGTTEIAVLSLGGIVTSESLRIAGDKIDLDIIK